MKLKEGKGVTNNDKEIVKLLKNNTPLDVEDPEVQRLFFEAIRTGAVGGEKEQKVAVDGAQGQGGEPPKEGKKAQDEIRVTVQSFLEAKGDPNIFDPEFSVPTAASTDSSTASTAAASTTTTTTTTSTSTSTTSATTSATGEADGTKKEVAAALSALQTAVRFNQEEVIQALLTAEAIKINLKNSNGETALTTAIRHSAPIGTVKKLLSAGADVNTKTTAGDTPLSICAEGQSASLARLLIEQKADVKYTDLNGDTLLMKAISKQNRDLVVTLLEGHPNVDAQNKRGVSAVHTSVRLGDVESLKLLLSQNAQLSSDKKGRTPLHYAVLNTKKQDVGIEVRFKMISILARHKVGIIDVADKEGLSALMICIQEKNTQLAKHLIAEGADVSKIPKAEEKLSTSGGGLTPLMFAAKEGNKEFCELLVEKKADPSLRDDDKRTAYYHAIEAKNEDVVRYFIELEQEMKDEDGEELNNADRQQLLASEGFLYASNHEITSIMQFLYKQFPVNCDVKTKDGFTALHFCAQRNNPGLVTWLVGTANAEVEERDKNGDTPLISAAKEGAIDALKVLVTVGNAVVDETDDRGATALCHAAQRGHKGVVQYLVDAKASINHLAENGWSPIVFACKAKQLDVLKTLLEQEGCAVDHADREGVTAVLRAARDNDWETVDWLRRYGKADLAIPSKTGETVMMYGCWFKQRKVVEDILAGFKKSGQFDRFLKQQRVYEPIGIDRDSKKWRLKLDISTFPSPAQFEDLFTGQASSLVADASDQFFLVTKDEVKDRRASFYSVGTRSPASPKRPKRDGYEKLTEVEMSEMSKDEKEPIELNILSARDGLDNKHARGLTSMTSLASLSGSPGKPGEEGKHLVEKKKEKTKEFSAGILNIWEAFIIAVIQDDDRMQAYFIDHFKDVIEAIDQKDRTKGPEEPKYTLIQYAIEEANADVVQFLMRYASQQEPVHKCLEFAHEFQNRADETPARKDDFEQTASEFTKMAITLFNRIESEYEAMWVLDDEVLQHALDWKNYSFVANPRVVRIADWWWDKGWYRIPKQEDGDEDKVPLHLPRTETITLSSLFLRDPLRFYRVPKIKFFTETVCFLSFLILFSSVLAQSIEVEQTIQAGEWALYFYALAYFGGEIPQIRLNPQEYLEDGWNQMDLTIVTFLVLIAFCRLPITAAEGHMKPVWVDNMYCVCSALCIIVMAFRSLFIFFISPAIGPLIISLQKMTGDIARYLLLLGVLIYAFLFAFIFVVETDVQSSNIAIFQNSRSTFLSLVDVTIGSGIDLSTIDGLASTARQNLITTMTVCYTFMVVIVLVNLLIAMMSSAFTEVQDKSTEVAIFNFVEATVEANRENDRMPPPLNVLAFLPRVIIQGIQQAIKSCKAAASKTHVKKSCKGGNCVYCLKDFCRCHVKTAECTAKFALEKGKTILVCPHCFRSIDIHRVKNKKKLLAEYLSLAVFCIAAPFVFVILLLARISVLISGSDSSIAGEGGGGGGGEVKSAGSEGSKLDQIQQKLKTDEQRDEAFRENITSQVRLLGEQLQDLVENRLKGDEQKNEEFRTGMREQVKNIFAGVEATSDKVNKMVQSVSTIQNAMLKLESSHIKLDDIAARKAEEGNKAAKPT